MAAQPQDFSSEPAVAKYHTAHPLCPLTASEISTTADLVRSVWPANIDLRFKVITLDEPAKKSMIPYLEAEHSGGSLPEIARKAFVSYYIRNTVSRDILKLFGSRLGVQRDGRLVSRLAEAIQCHFTLGHEGSRCCHSHQQNNRTDRSLRNASTKPP